ncbi:myb-like protein X isoform X1 [Macrobrachium rosenbergii]|uniref:myb-like protein X isoform X1 n=1 Tax=Macrobrachium rosenbergii TaxID=79674 RepID=UPI0034D733E0
MSLIKIRGRTILSPILTEEERIEARAFREKAVLYQRRLEHQRNQQLQQCNYQYQQQQKSNINYQQQTRTSTASISGAGSTNKEILDNERLSKKTNKNLNKNEIRQPIPAGIKNLSCGETSSSSAPSSQGSGGELTSEGLEDSPSAANVSVQTESSGSITTSTDLHHYLNNSLDTSLDTSISVSHDIWHNSPSLMEVDEALLQSDSTEVATNLILGRLHPSVILNSSFKPKTSRQESQTTETTSSTLIQGHLSSGKHTISEGQDTATVGSVSLSFASVSEEGSEEGLEVLEVSEELLDISEEDKDASFPSELESDVQRYDKDDSQDNTSSRTKSTSGVDTDEGFPSAKEKWRENVVQQRDSGRGTSHSDYLDSYLDLLTSRSGSSLSFHPSGPCVSKCESTVPTTTVSAVSGISGSKMTDNFSPKLVSSLGAVKSAVKPRLVSSEENLEKICPASKQIVQKDFVQKDLAIKKLKSPAQPTETPEDKDLEKEDDSITEEIEAFDRIDDWQKELLLKPRASSATPERKERKRSRSRRWSSCQPLDPRRSVGSKYLDSYLGKLTDDAWLQYPTQLCERRMVYLSSDEYINAVRPKPAQKSFDQQFTSTDMSENSASEETKNFHTSTESLHSSNPDGGIKENLADRNSGFSLAESSVAEQEADEQTTSKDSEVRGGVENTAVPQDVRKTNFAGDVPPKLEAASVSDDADVTVCQLKQDSKKLSEDDVGRHLSESNDQQGDSTNLDTVVIVEYDRGEAEKMQADITSRLPDESKVLKDDEMQKGNTVSSGVSQKPHESGVYDEDRYLKASRSEYRSKAEPRSVETTPTTENDDGQESSSDDSSETEPSTIVCLEDIPLESPSEGKTLLSTDSEEHSFIKGEKGISDKGENGISSLGMNGLKSHRKETVIGISEPSEALSSSIGDQSNLTNHSIKLITSQKMDKFKIENLSNGDSAPLKLMSGKTKIFESDVEESEEECLVVQVILDENGAHENQKSLCDIAKLETKKKHELNNESITRNELITVANIADSEMELAQGSPVNGWEVTPEQGAKEAMSQVLSLLKAKQEQELEELRMRQEAEVHQVIEKLQKVSPQQLHAFLSASNDSDVLVIPKSRSSPQNVGQISTSSSADFQTQSEHLEVKSAARSISPRSPRSPKRSVDLKKKSSPDEASRVRAMRHVHEDDDDDQSTVPCIAYPMVTSTESVWSSSHPDASSAGYIAEYAGHPPTCSVMSVSDYSACISHDTYPTSSLPLMSESNSSATHVSIMSGSCSSITGSLVESPKPRPSNHTNIMPSYFMYDENRVSGEVQKDDNYRAHIAEQNSTFVESITRPQNVPQVSSSFGNSDHSAVGGSAHVKNNNPETVDTMSYINGNCLSYGDGMQYYRLFTGDEDNSTTKTTSHSSQIVSYPPQSTDTVVQPGLFRVIGNSPRPTSITSLLKEHPEMFGEEVLEVNLEHDGEWTSTEAELGEHHVHSREHHSHSISHGGSHGGTVYLHPPTTTTSTSSIVAEGGLDMVPERESAAAPSHHLGENLIFIRGITRLQACVRRYLTQRLLRTKFVQEQLATLSEIAKLAQQFHRDILTDNIQKGDVDFHKTLYNQERLARDRIRRVFVVLTVEEQMALIHRDRQLWHLQQERKRGSDPRISPIHVRTRSRYQEDRQRSTVPVRASTKRTSPQGSRSQQERKTRTTVSGATKSIHTPLVQPTLVQPPQSASLVRSARSDYRMSPRGSRLPVHVARSSSNLDSGTHSAYRSSSRAARSPSQDSQSSVQTASYRSGSNTSRSNSTSRLCGRTGTQAPSRVTSHMTSTRTCTIRNATNRVTPPRTAAKTSVVGRRPWR